MNVGAVGGKGLTGGAGVGSDLAGRSIISLPLYPVMKDEDVDQVVDALRRVVAASRR